MVQEPEPQWTQPDTRAQDPVARPQLLDPYTQLLDPYTLLLATLWPKDRWYVAHTPRMQCMTACTVSLAMAARG